MDMFKKKTDFIFCTFLEYESDLCVNIFILDRKKERYSNSPDTLTLLVLHCCHAALFSSDYFFLIIRCSPLILSL